MRAEFWAVCTALCWGVGSLLEKRGVKIGGLAPVMGTTVRTLFSLLLLLAVSFPYFAQVKTAGIKSIVLIAVGGGVLAGGLGIMFLYSGLKAGNLSTVMTIAFCLTPVISGALGYLVLHEKPVPLQVLGMILCITGAVLVTYFKRI
ncbi:MAG: DMT family transporter [bacterium]